MDHQTKLVLTPIPLQTISPSQRMCQDYLTLSENVPETANITVRLAKGKISTTKFETGRWRIYVSHEAKGVVVKW